MKLIFKVKMRWQEWTLRSQCRSINTVRVEPEVRSALTSLHTPVRLNAAVRRREDVSHWEIIHSPLWTSTSTASSEPASSHAISPEPPYPALPLFTSSAFTSTGVHCYDASKFEESVLLLYYGPMKSVILYFKVLFSLLTNYLSMTYASVNF